LQAEFTMQDPAGPDTALDEKIRLRRAAVQAFMAGLADWEAVAAAMDRMNIAWGEVRAGAKLADQPTVRHRGSIARVDDRAGGTRPIPQSPYRFSDATSQVRGPARIAASTTPRCWPNGSARTSPTSRLCRTRGSCCKRTSRATPPPRRAAAGGERAAPAARS
jgi:hypothetical protein